jgi:type IV pilus assembly protein PilY1
MKIQQSPRAPLHLLCAFALGAVLAYPARAAVTPAQSPLALTTSAKPNIMLMLDNSGSMSNIVPETPYDASTTYIASCPGANLVPAGTSVDIRFDGVPKIRYSSVNYVLGTAAGQRCFDTTATYGARLNLNGSSTNTLVQGGYLDADYTGNYLNWYFNASNTTPAWTATTQQKKPGTLSRIEIARTSAKSLVDSLNNVRLGLSTYNSADGGSLREIVGDIDAAKKTSVKTKIDALTASGMTPLAETLSDIGRYFATGATGSLTLHPGKSNETTASVDTIFNSHNLTNNSGQTIVNPIQYSCQKSFAVLMTDGRPQGDRAISASLRDYTGDCATSGLCDATPNTTNLPLSSLTVTTFQNGTKVGRTYESQGSDYLDDVAQGLFEMDLRPDLVDANGAKNNLTTYTIGFADTTVANDPLLSDAATRGGGLFISAADSTALGSAFQSAILDIALKDVLAAAVATNSTRLGTDTAVYQAKFDSTTWSGHLLAFAVNADGSIGTQLWDAGASGKIPTSGRNVVTYNPTSTMCPSGATSTKGVLFQWGNLNCTQQAALNANTTLGGGVTAANVGQKTLDYIRGDQTQEKTAGPFRQRTQLLGDIVNSNSQFVGSQNFGYDSLPVPEGPSYITFRNSTAHQHRRRMLYFGANDGMLHGIDAGSFGTSSFNNGTGAEILAYVPDAVIPNLSKLTDPAYAHQYFVDGSPMAADAFIASAWKTVLLGTTGAGGKAVFALDVTAPDSFDASKVMWEISTTTSPTATDRTTDSASVAGFQNNLGFTLPQPSLVRMKDGSWAAIVANGYGSVNNRAVLYIIDAATGNLIRSIDTKVGSATAPNGLSTPIAVDVDNDRITDYIYAGDLQGNLWKFDVTSSNPNSWEVAYKTKPLYVACVSSTSPCPSADIQPITAKPQVGRVGAGQSGGLMVYFGTGKYFETGDPSTTQTQTLYGIWDKCDKNSSSGCDGQVAGRGNLQQQTITQELANSGLDLRLTSTCEVNYGSTALSGTVTAPCTTTANRLGWYLDFIQPATSNLPAGSDLGERIVSTPILRGDSLIFTTLIPSPSSAVCSPGATGWLMELASTSGKQFTSSQWDINGDGKFDSSDQAIAGIRLDNISGTPGIVSDGDKEHLYPTGLKKFDHKLSIPTGRRAWRQLR